MILGTWQWAAPAHLLWELAILAGLGYWWSQRHRPQRPAAVLFSNLDLFALPVRPSLRLRLAWLPEALTLVGLMLLPVALARPQQADPASAVSDRSAAVVLVVDVSGSMATEEPTARGQERSRLARVQQLLVATLAKWPPLLAKDRAGATTVPRVGLVTFAESSEVICPLTEDLETIAMLITQLQVRQQGTRTQVGDAVALALSLLRPFALGQDETGENPSSQQEFFSSASLLLCSDGGHNVSQGLPPAQAARIAANLGIPINTLGVGTALTMPGNGHEAEDATLRGLAQLTGGQYFPPIPPGDRAEEKTTFSLAQTFMAQALPPAQTARRSVRYAVWRERYPVVLLAAVGCFTLAALLRATWLALAPNVETF